MLAIFILALVALAGAAEERIVGGTTAVRGEHYYIASLQTRSGNLWYHICGGVIYNRNYIVTAAHCLGSAASTYRLVLGEHRQSTTSGNEQVSAVTSYTIHPNYNANGAGFPNDIAVMLLTTPVTYNSFVGAGTFATSGSFLGQSCILSGWGRTVGGGSAADTLLKVSITKIANNECSTRWAGVSGATINTGHICFYTGSGISACNGDSGGPARCGNTIVGVTSWGISTCSGTYPSVYTRVSTFASWLQSQAGTNA